MEFEDLSGQPGQAVALWEFQTACFIIMRHIILMILQVGVVRRRDIELYLEEGFCRAAVQRVYMSRYSVRIMNAGV